MFAGTLTLTIAGNAYVCQRVNQDSYGSEYQFSGATDALNLKIRHSTDSVDKDGIVMKRHNIYVERVIYATPSTSLKKQSCTFTMRGGKLEDPVPMADVAKAAIAWLSASTYSALNDLSIGVN